MFKAKIALAALTLLLLGAFAHADTIVYNNGGPNQQNGNEMTEWVQTEDFTLTSGQTISDIHFWDVDQGTYAGSITWWIVGDSGGNPNFNDILGTGNLDVTRVATGNCLFFGCEYENSWNINPLSLTPGTYHLALHNGPVSFDSRSEFYWETTDPNGTPTGRECDLTSGACYGSWNDNGQEHAFYLSGGGATTPEPGTLALMATGLLGVFSQLRRRR
jgi:PEP-CTERM motif